MHPALLSQPIATLVRTTSTLEPVESLARAAKLFRESVFDRLPVVDEDRIVGIVTQQSLALALASGAGFEESITVAYDPHAPIVSAHITGAEALRIMADSGVPELVVCDQDGYLIGILGAADLTDTGPRYITPPVVGGMATPFGVYLTTGSLRAGASDLALVTTGMLLFTLLFVSTWISGLSVTWMLGHGLNHHWASNLEGILPILLFLLGMRLIPLSSIHASEHMVVHAIERGEPLEPAIVKRMPRVHPRCGTNLAVGASIFFGLLSWEWVPSLELRTIVALIITVFTWRSVGGFFQQFITTKPPKDKHVAMAISAGKELLTKFRTIRKRSNIPMRIFNSGMLHVIAGSMIVFGLLQLFSWLFKVDLPIPVSTISASLPGG